MSRKRKMAAHLTPPSIDALINQALAIEDEQAQEAGALGFMARAMVQATLPHRAVDGTYFERKNGAFTLSLLASPKIGLPYGSIPRLLLAWVTTEAVKTKSFQRWATCPTSCELRPARTARQSTQERWDSCRWRESTQKSFHPCPLLAGFFSPAIHYQPKKDTTPWLCKSLSSPKVAPASRNRPRLPSCHPPRHKASRFLAHQPRARP